MHRQNKLNASSINPKHDFMTRAVLRGYLGNVTYGKSKGKRRSIGLSNSEYRLIKEFTKVMKVTPRQISKNRSKSKTKSHIYTVYPHIQVKRSNKTSEVKIFIEDRWN
jgi:diketogulonate reductase-like aldo/keto reductase